MSEMFGVPQTPTPGSTGSASGSSNGHSAKDSAKDTALEQAQGVAQEGVEGGKHVASVAADQAKEVVSQTGSQAQALLAEAKSELIEQAASQKNRVADQLHTLAKEFGSMASSSDQDGLASGLAEQASRQLGTIAHWVSEREPGSLVSELKDFARAKPGVFLAVAAGVGLAAGRMTRGVKAGPSEGDSSSAPPVERNLPAAGSPPGQAPAESMPSDVGRFADPLPAGPAVGVGGSHTDVGSEEPFASRTPGLAP